MKKVFNTLTILGFVLFLAGCGARSMVVLIPDPDGNVGQLVVSNEGGQQVLNKANQSVQVTDRKTAPGKVTTAQRRRNPLHLFRCVGRATAAAGNIHSLFPAGFQ